MVVAGAVERVGQLARREVVLAMLMLRRDALAMLRLCDIGYG